MSEEFITVSRNTVPRLNENNHGRQSFSTDGLWDRHPLFSSEDGISAENHRRLPSGSTVETFLVPSATS